MDYDRPTFEVRYDSPAGVSYFCAAFDSGLARTFQPVDAFAGLCPDGLRADQRDARIRNFAWIRWPRH